MSLVRNWILAAILLAACSVIAAPAEKAKPGKIEQGVDRILEVMQAKLKAKEIKSTDDLEPYFKQLRGLYEENKHLKNWDAAMPMITAINLWTKYFEMPERAKPYLESLAKDMAGTEIGKNATDNLKTLDTTLKQREQQMAMMMKQQEMMMARIKAEQEKAGIFVGKPMPEFTRVDSKGNPFSLAALKGHPTLMVFWASWCGPCMREAPNIKAVYEKYKEQGLRVIGVNKDNSVGAMQKAIEGVGMTWPQFQDVDDKLSIQFAAGTLPTLYLVDAEGNLAATGLDVRGPNLEKSVRKLLEL